VKSRKASSEARTVATRAAATSSNLQYKDDIYNQLFSKKRRKRVQFFNNYLMMYTLDPDWLARQRKRWVLSLPTGQEIRHFLATWRLFAKGVLKNVFYTSLTKKTKFFKLQGKWHRLWSIFILKAYIYIISVSLNSNVTKIPGLFFLRLL
jgi:hypothetical protein